MPTRGMVATEAPKNLVTEVTGADLAAGESYKIENSGGQLAYYGEYAAAPDLMDPDLFVHTLGPGESEEITVAAGFGWYFWAMFSTSRISVTGVS